MAISYPLTIPNHDFASMSMRLTRKIATAESPFTYQTQIYEHSGSRWEAEVTLPPLTHTEARAWETFFLALKGQVGTFKMYNPLAANPQGTATANVRMPVAKTAGTTTITLDTSTGTGTLKAGDYLEISDNLHVLLEDVSLSATNVDVVITPPLRSDISAFTAITTVNAKGTWRLATSDVGWSINNASLYGFTFACVEVLSA
tara:strand:+ start:167 stop:772 length:606 start_codon:yes stop_codon:yes gene_type:complete